ncbi:hypothetical protein K493DRAFT_339082 [Basidiobolus meristosporus CBS 931.73]|uniref:SH3 domain-containing protein n=1 Tax=Basidiobolus meristosporus CBS 931.73 TaxID=1314790 RepID=A0A1Y1Y1W2_9FUNG|nr:hypothetical protein K493DRAFT_339082 [Basidiobolus meristosporus CBS 931.73]|eukprot:ORX91875.1 hypothetical protein K493DRAFT_339082 [Basidiobolus meristosporus CBS 931.73]
MRPRHLVLGVLSLYNFPATANGASTQHRCWDNDSVELSECLGTRITSSGNTCNQSDIYNSLLFRPTDGPSPSVSSLRLIRRDEEQSSTIGELIPAETALSAPTPTASEVTPTFDENASTQSKSSNRELITPVLPNQVENSKPTEAERGEQSASENKELMGLPLGVGIGIVVGIIAIVSIVVGILIYLYFRRRRASRWPKSSKDHQGYIDLHDVPSTSRKAHPPPALSSSPDGYDGALHPSMHPAVISARARVNSQLSLDPQPEMSEGLSKTTRDARPGYPKPTIYRLSVAPMLASQQELGLASGSSSVEKPNPESLPDYSFVMSAILSYVPRQEGEIEVNVGDELAITDEMGPDWLIGFNLTTQSVTGGFPRTCVTGNSYH